MTNTTLGPPLTIFVHESTQTFSSVEEAERVIAAAVEEGTTSSLSTRGAVVELPKEHYQYLIPLDAPGSRIPRLRDVRFENGQWLITLHGLASFRSLFVTIDSDYRLLNVKRDQ